VDAVLLPRVYVLSGMGMQARAVRVPGVTAYPAGARTARQARGLLRDPGGRAASGSLIRGGDGTFTAACDGVLSGNGRGVTMTPARSPRAGSYAGRFAGALRRECPDRVLVLGERHLRGILAGYARRYDATVRTRDCSGSLRGGSPARRPASPPDRAKTGFPAA
jgi:putative transposase